LASELRIVQNALAEAVARHYIQHASTVANLDALVNAMIMRVHGTRALLEALLEAAKYSSTPGAVGCTFQVLVGNTLDLWTQILTLTTMSLLDDTCLIPIIKTLNAFFLLPSE
jgi:hypothetical protein